MALRTRAHVAVGYHIVIALLLLLFGGALLGVGIWLVVTERGGRLELEFSGSSVWDLARNFGVAGIVVGVFLLGTAVASFIALSRRLVGKIFRFIYVLAALLVVAVLVLIAVLSLLVVANRDSGPVKDFLADAWEATGDDPELENNLCEIQAEFNCRGFDDTDCTLCPIDSENDPAICRGPQADRCPACGNVGRPINTGCYDEIIASARTILLPVGIVAAVVAAFVLLDCFVVCFI